MDRVAPRETEGALLIMTEGRAKDLRRRLNPRQEIFVREYLTCFNASQAARKAGYSAKSAHTQGSLLLKHSEVSRVIAESTQAIERQSPVTREEVIAMLRAAYQKGMAIGQIGPAGRCAELLGKTLAMFVDQFTQVPGEGVADEDLADMIAKDENGNVDQKLRRLVLRTIRGGKSGPDGNPSGGMKSAA